MDEKKLRQLAQTLADARRMLEIGDTAEAGNLLDHCARLIPDKYWPTEQEATA